MKKFLFVLLFMLSAQVSASVINVDLGVTASETEGDINAFDITSLMEYPLDSPVWAALAAGGNPNTDTLIPINYNVVTGEVFDVKAQAMMVTPNDPGLGGGFILNTQAGFGILPTAFFEVALFDGTDWHTADKITSPGDNTLSFLFEPDFDGLNPLAGGGQAGMLMADVTAGIDPPAPVPVPSAVWLFGSGLIGMVAVARRRNRNMFNNDGSLAV